MRKPIRRLRQDALFCSLCGQEIPRGAEYWVCNGSYICEDCLPGFARAEFAPCHEIRGKEMFFYDPF